MAFESFFMVTNNRRTGLQAAEAQEPGAQYKEGNQRQLDQQDVRWRFGLEHDIPHCQYECRNGIELIEILEPRGTRENG